MISIAGNAYKEKAENDTSVHSRFFKLTLSI